MISDNEKDFIVRRWNLCERNRKIRLAAEYIKSKRTAGQEMNWWQFLEKRLPHGNETNLHHEPELPVSGDDY